MGKSYQTIIKPTYIRENRTRSGNYGVEKLGRDWLESGKIRREVGKKRAAPKPIRGFPVSQKWEIWPEKSGNRVLYGAQKVGKEALQKWEQTVCMELKSGKRGIKKVGTYCLYGAQKWEISRASFLPQFSRVGKRCGTRPLGYARGSSKSSLRSLGGLGRVFQGLCGVFRG